MSPLLLGLLCLALYFIQRPLICPITVLAPFFVAPFTPISNGPGAYKAKNPLMATMRAFTCFEEVPPLKVIDLSPVYPRPVTGLLTLLLECIKYAIPCIPAHEVRHYFSWTTELFRNIVYSRIFAVLGQKKVDEIQDLMLSNLSWGYPRHFRLYRHLCIDRT